MPTYFFIFNKRYYLLCFLIFHSNIFPSCLFAQSINSYQSSTNLLYWQNRKPHAAYWQQDVHYEIDAVVDEKTDIITAKMKLTYWNHSPDTLYEVFFHLYENAFQPCSYYHDLHRQNHLHPEYGKYEIQCLGTTVDSFRHDGNWIQPELDNTILRAKLNHPILPGGVTVFELNFKTYFDSGSVRRRNKVFKSYGNKHYDGTHWYPVLAVYDSKFAWTTDQHLGREFYANFGTFDVKLNFASNMVVEATGILQNRAEALPDSLRALLDISNFKNKPLGSKPSIIIPYDSVQRKTWIYHAENVHNFAFTADPSYRIGEAYTKDGVQCIALVQESQASNWQPVAAYTAQVIELFSRDFGQYAYPKMVVADARDGMEYPMLTLCGGIYPFNKALISHEVGHNWFYGMIGSNETYRAMMDEGFTQFITVWALENISDKKDTSFVKINPKVNKIKYHPEPVSDRQARAYLSYLTDAAKYNDMPLNTHSDMFNGAIRQGGGYRHVYGKTATMLFNLQYVLGDTLFLQAMQHYFNQWKFAHPYPEDFRNSIIQYTHADLNWFFDQWLETTKNIDYKIGKVITTKNKETTKTEKWQHQIKIKRKGEMQMPIDFSVVYKNGDSAHFYIPNTWFEKQTQAQILPRWIGWQKLKPIYTATVFSNEKIKEVVLDPSHRLADIYLLNNSSKLKSEWHWDRLINRAPEWEKYRFYVRPEMAYNAIDGFKIGARIRGDYFQRKHKFNLAIWLPTTLLEGSESYHQFSRFTLENIQGKQKKTPVDVFNYRFEYETALDKMVKDLWVFWRSSYFNGLEYYQFGLKYIRGSHEFSIFNKLMTRPKNNKDVFVLNGLWQTDKINHTLNLKWKVHYDYSHGKGSFELLWRSNSLASDFDYSYVEALKINHTSLGKLDLHTRMYGRYGFGKNTPWESGIQFAGANNEDLMDIVLVNAKGIIPGESVQNLKTFSFQQSGGLNIRGYAGMPSLYINEMGAFARMTESGVALNAELDIDRIILWKPKKMKNIFHIDLYLFADVGWGKEAKSIEVESLENIPISEAFSFQDPIFNSSEDKILADAGVGVALTLKKISKKSVIKPFTIRLDAPFWVNKGKIMQQKNVESRWVFGLYRSF